MRFFLLFLSAFTFCCTAGSAQKHFSLSQALKSAAENNSFFKADQLEADLAASDIITARLRPNPELNNQSLVLSRASHFPEGTSWMNGKNMQTWWQLTRNFTVAGQRKNRIDAARVQADIAEINVREICRNLYGVTASKWIEVWIAKRRADLLQTALENIDSLVNINHYRYDKEVITATELYRTQLIARQYSVQLQNARQEYRRLLNELKFLMGTDEDADIDETDMPDIGVPGSVDSLVQIAMENRPDVQASAEAVKLAAVNIRLQQSLAYPQPELGLIYNPQNTLPYAGIFVTVPLPFSDRNQGGIQRARIQKVQADYRLQAMQRSLKTELGVAVDFYNTHKKNVNDYRDIVSRARQILDNVSYAYTKGGTTIIDFLEAQRSWLETQQQFYEELEQYRQSQIQVLNSAGLLKNLAQ